MKRSDPRRIHTVESWDDEGGIGPPGATWLETEQAWNFTLYSRHATGVTLLLYDTTNFVEPVFQLQLNPLKNKTARIWHCLVQRESAPAARYYGFRVHGLWDPKNGHRFDQEKILFDPYEKRRSIQVGTTGTPCSECCLVRKRNSIGARNFHHVIRTMRLFMSCTSKGSPRALIQVWQRRNAAHFSD